MAYEHVVVVMSIVLGMAVTQLLKGAAQLYRARRRVRPYWLHSPVWPTVAFYFLTAFTFPDPSEPVANMKEYYFSNRVGFFGTLRWPPSWPCSSRFFSFASTRTGALTS